MEKEKGERVDELTRWEAVVVEKVEEEVGVMAEKITELRCSLPDHLNSTLSSILASHRRWAPLVSLSSSLPQPQHHQHEDEERVTAPSGDLSGVLSVVNGETVDEIQLLRQKISSNITALPGVLKRTKDCISRIDKLVSSNGTIHPAFKRKKR